MNTKLLVFALFGAAAILLFTTDKGKQIREDIADSAEDWGDAISDFAESAGDKLSDLKSRVAKEATGLSKDARKRIMAILEEGTDSAKDLKKKAGKQFA